MESTLERKRPRVEIASLDPRALSELIKKHVEAFGIKMPPEFFNEEFGELVKKCALEDLEFEHEKRLKQAEANDEIIENWFDKARRPPRTRAGEATSSSPTRLS